MSDLPELVSVVPSSAQKKANRKRMTVVIAMALIMLWNGRGSHLLLLFTILDVGIKDTTSQTEYQRWPTNLGFLLLHRGRCPPAKQDRPPSTMVHLLLRDDLC